MAGYAVGVTVHTATGIVRSTFGAEVWATAGYQAMLPAIVSGGTFTHLFVGITGVKPVSHE